MALLGRLCLRDQLEREVGLVAGDGGAGILDDDDDGVSDETDACPNTPVDEAGVVDSTGCAPSQLDDDEDGVSDAVDECAGTATGAEVDQSGCAADQVGQIDPDWCSSCWSNSMKTLFLYRRRCLARKLTRWPTNNPEPTFWII